MNVETQFQPAYLNQVPSTNTYVTVNYYDSVMAYIGNMKSPIMMTMGVVDRVMLYTGEESINPENVYELMAPHLNGKVMYIPVD